MRQCQRYTLRAGCFSSRSFALTCGRPSGKVELIGAAYCVLRQGVRCRLVLRTPGRRRAGCAFAHAYALASKLNRAGLAGHAARVPWLRNVHRDRGRCRSDPCRLPRGGRTVGHGRAATAVPGDHRPREGAGMCPHHRRLAASARGAMPGDAAASWQNPLALVGFRGGDGHVTRPRL